MHKVCALKQKPIVQICFCCHSDYDDLEFSIVSLEGRQWLFEAESSEVCRLCMLWLVAWSVVVTFRDWQIDELSSLDVLCSLLS